jgi:hypothetical protein
MDVVARLEDADDVAPACGEARVQRPRLAPAEPAVDHHADAVRPPVGGCSRQRTCAQLIVADDCHDLDIGVLERREPFERSAVRFLVPPGYDHQRERGDRRVSPQVDLRPVQRRRRPPGMHHPTQARG